MHFKISYLLILISLNLIQCKKKYFPKQFTLVTSRYGEMKIFEESKSKKVLFQDSKILDFNIGIDIELHEILQLKTKDVFLFLVQDINKESCNRNFFIITIHSEQKFKTFHDIGNCKDNPEISIKEETVLLRFDKSPNTFSIQYSIEDDKLKIIGDSNKTAKNKE